MSHRIKINFQPTVSLVFIAGVLVIRLSASINVFNYSYSHALYSDCSHNINLEDWMLRACVAGAITKVFVSGRWHLWS